MQITELPNDFLLKVIQYLDQNSLTNFRLMCRQFYQLSIVGSFFSRIASKTLSGYGAFCSVIFLNDELKTAFLHAKTAHVTIGLDSLLTPDCPRLVSKFHFNSSAIKMYKAFESQFSQSKNLQTKAEASYQLFKLNLDCDFGYSHGTWSEFFTKDLTFYYFNQTLVLHKNILQQQHLNVDIRTLYRAALLPFQYKQKDYDPTQHCTHEYLNAAVNQIGRKVLIDILTLLYDNFLFNGVGEKYIMLVARLHNELDRKDLLQKILGAGDDIFTIPWHRELNALALNELKGQEKMEIVLQ